MLCTLLRTSLGATLPLLASPWETLSTLPRTGIKEKCGISRPSYRNNSTSWSNQTVSNYHSFIVSKLTKRLWNSEAKVLVPCQRWSIKLTPPFFTVDDAAESDQGIEEGIIRLDNKKDMHLMNASMFETIRLTCSPIVPHQATRDSTVGGKLKY